MSNQLLGMGAAELADRIARGEASSRQVVEAHIARIDAVNRDLNAVVVRCFDEAMERASAADEAQRKGERWGVLHGVPITIKESFFVAGTPSTIGLPHLASDRQHEDAVLVQRLKRAGAIVVGKTNVPQLMLSHETDNPLYGRTNNPWDVERTPGGSSGGEAAIIAAGGSPLGLASDLGGSIRLPSHFCGVNGIKPTTSRLPQKGTRTNLHGMESIQFQPGPIARRVADLELALRVLIGDDPRSETWELPPVPAPDSHAVAVRGLRIGFWDADGYFAPSPAVRRAVRESAEALRGRGAAVVPFQPPAATEVLELYLSLLAADGGANARRLCGTSPLDRSLRRLFRVAQLPSWLRWPTVWWLRWRRQFDEAQLLEWTRGRSADEYWQLTYRMRGLVRRFFEAMDAARIDVLLCPPHGLCAFPHRRGGGLIGAASYCFLVNLLGVPGGVTPVTRVRPGEESDRPASRELVESFARSSETGSAGLPVGVQVFGRPWREDQVLAVMAALEGEFLSRDDYPRLPSTM